ncbi:MAG: hypothetical protein WAV31_04590 [Candidatus Moraniibacteriota bacterium]
MKSKIYIANKNNQSNIMHNYQGIIIEESLENKEVLDKVKIISTKIEPVTDEHKTPWISQWTLHTVDIPENTAQAIAEEISHSLDQEHDWYADFKKDTNHYIIFRDKVFFIDRNSATQYAAAKAHGLSLGIPEYQIDFRPDTE